MDEQLTIEKVAFEGRGVARRRDGKVVFVEGALPGDTVLDNPSIIKKKFDVIQAPTWIDKSPHHMPSKCPIAYECGGCQWQYANYEDQVSWKKDFIREALNRIGQIAELPPLEFFAPSQNLGYRPRLNLHGLPVDGKLKWGFYKKGSHQLVQANECAVSTPLISEALKYLNLAQIFYKNKTQLHFQEITPLEHQEKSLTITITANSSKKLKTAISSALRDLPIYWIGSIDDVSKAPLTIWSLHHSLKFLTKPNQFQQSHHEQNHRLQNIIESEVELRKPDSITDLFCGSGNLSLRLANKGYSVLGLETCKTAIRVASENLKINGIEGDYKCMPAKQISMLLQKSNRRNHLMIVDPPRAGLLKAIDDILELKPTTIIYVSCQPNTLARDTSRIIGAGYKISRLIGMDFFPGTYHVESVLIFDRSGEESEEKI